MTHIVLVPVTQWFHFLLTNYVFWFMLKFKVLAIELYKFVSINWTLYQLDNIVTII